MTISQEIVSELVKAGKEPKDLALAYTAFFFRHLYMRWRVLSNTYPYEEAIRLYLDTSWLHPRFGLGSSFKRFAEANRLTIEDVVNFAKVVSEQWKELPVRLDIIKATKNEVIMENQTGFCPNPAFGPRPWDRYLDLCVYSFIDGWLGTGEAFNKGYLAAANLIDEYETEMIEAVCLGHPRCRWVIRKKKKKITSS